MAEIKPFRAWRYNESLQKKIGQLVSPLFDVVSATQRKRLYDEEFSSIHLSVPSSSDDLASTSDKVKEWKQQGTLVQDDLPAIYVYYQYFTLPNSTQTRVRKGFIAQMRLYDWDEKVLLRHENTMPFSVKDRVEVLDHTQLNMSPTHGLYTDPACEIETYLDHAITHPISETEDYQGARDVLAVIQDQKIVQRIMKIMQPQKIILADGHHRYEGSLQYQKQRAKNNPSHTGKEGYNFHMMYFTNTATDDLCILPTHRIISQLPHFSPTEFLEKLTSYFTLTAIPYPQPNEEIIIKESGGFGLILDKAAYKLQLLPEQAHNISWNFPDAIKTLDLTLLHYFIIEKCLGIPGPQQRSSKNLSFERDLSKCLKRVSNKEAQCVVLTKAIDINTVKEVCESGYTLPQKSTYFYPKVICGLLFGSVKEEEQSSIHDQAFR